jgi:hypothetical protein
MQVWFQHPRLPKGIVCDNVPYLRNARDIEDSQGALHVRKRTAHEQLPGCKQLLPRLEMLAKQGLFGDPFPALPGRARGRKHGKHRWLPFARHISLSQIIRRACKRRTLFPSQLLLCRLLPVAPLERLVAHLEGIVFPRAFYLPSVRCHDATVRDR